MTRRTSRVALKGDLHHFISNDQNCTQGDHYVHHLSVQSAGHEEDAPSCWICLSNDRVEQLEKPCFCPRYVHRRCLAQWQIVSAGKSEEEKCRFCNKRLPDWRECLMHKAKAEPVMTVTLNGQNHILKVESGELGRKAFEQQIRCIYNLKEEDNISVTFGIKEPFSGGDVVLEGWGAWAAAVECASCSAATRSTTTPTEGDLQSEVVTSWYFCFWLNKQARRLFTKLWN